MADGNLGSLWMNLGLKETISKDLKKLQQEFSGTDEKAKKVQNTIKEIASALKKPTDTNAISRAFSKLSTLLEKSKTDAKDLAVVLKSLNAKDVLSIFDGKVTASNAKSYLDMINKIREAINSLGRAPGENTFNLSLDLNKAAEYLSTITEIKERIKYVGDYAKGLGKDSAWLGMLDSTSLNFKRLRSNMLSALNDGSWSKRHEEFSKEYSKILDYLLRNINEINLSSSESQRKVTETAIAATDTLKKEEEQAKKTAEAVASIGEKKQPVMKERAQENTFNTDVDKMIGNGAAKKIATIKEESEKSQKAVQGLKTEINEILNAFRGRASKTLGVGDAGEKGRQYIDILNQINKKKAELLKTDGGSVKAAEIDYLVRNAQKYILLLRDIDREYEKISNMKTINPNVDDKNIKKALGLIEHFQQQLTSLEALQNIDRASVLGNYKTFWGDTRKEANNLAKGLENSNTLSDLQNKADRANARLAETMRLIEKLDRAIDRGKSQGFNTDELFTNRAALLNRKAEFERALTKDTKRLSDVNYMAGLYSDTAKDIKLASVALEHFGNVQQKVNEQAQAVRTARKAEASVNKEILQDYDKQAQVIMRQQIATQRVSDLQEKVNERRVKQANDITLAETRQRKVLADLDSRLANAHTLVNTGSQVGARTTGMQTIIAELEKYKATIQGFGGKDLLSFDYKNTIAQLGELKSHFNDAAKAQSSLNKKAEADKTQRETNVRRMSELYADLNRQIAEAEKYGFRGLELSVDISKLDKAVADARELAELISKVNPRIMGRGGNASYEDYVSLAKNIKKDLDSAVKSQKELNSEKEKANSKKAAEQARAEAQARRDAAKAEREQNALEKQRQRELENSKSRIYSMNKALENLRVKQREAMRLKVDTSEIEAKIRSVETQLIDLKNIQQGLSMKDMSFVGRLGNIGNGLEVRSANDLAHAYDLANKEAQKGIDLEQKRQAEIAASAAKARNDLAAAFAGANGEAKKMQGVINDIKSLFLQGGIIFGAQQFFNSVVKTGGEIVQQHIALRSILGDATKADELFAQTQQLALQSPFKFGDLNRDVKQLAAFGVEANELYDTTKRLADIASGLGVSFERLGLAYGQVKARSWLDGKELRQFAYAGLPLLQRITEMYNATNKNGKNNYKESDIKEMISKRQVSFGDVQKVLWDMTDEGGQFYNMQFVLSETLLGKWNKLIDAWEIMLSKFADGKNVIGGTFSFLISQVTNLVLTIDKLTPALLAVGGVMLARKLSPSFGTTGLKEAYDKKITSQLRSYAIEQQQLVTEGKISQAIARQNVQKRGYILAEETSLKASMARLALEGKMSALQMARAVKEGLIAPELIQQLTIMGLITAKQEEMILKGNLFGLTMAAAGNKIKMAFNAMGGWIGLVIGAIAQIGISVYNEIEAIDQKAKELKDPSSERMKPYYDILGEEKSSNDKGLKAQVEKMKELLKNSNAYTETLQEQVGKVKTLGEQYDILKQKVTEAKDVEAGHGDIMANAIAGSRAGFKYNLLADTITENAADLDKSLSKMQVKLSAFDENTKKKMHSVANSILGPSWAAKSLGEKISELRNHTNGDWRAFVLQMLKYNRDTSKSIASIGIAAQDVTDDISTIAHTNVPNLIGSIRDQLGMSEKQFRTWCRNNSSEFRDMLLAAMDAAKWLVPEINEELKKLTGYKFEENDNPGEELPLTGLKRRVLTNLGNKKDYGLIEPYLDDTSWYKSKNQVKDRLQEIYNELESRRRSLKAGKATKSEVDEINAEYQALFDVTKKGLGYTFIPEDKKSNKTPKDKSRKDKELEDLEKRIELYKKLYNVIKENEKLYGKGALAQTALDEEFVSVFKDKNRFPISDYTDYKKSINELLKGFNVNTDDRRNFVDKEQIGIQEEQRRKTADSRKDELKNLGDQLNIIQEQYETYKKIYELTGNKSGAQNIAFGGWIGSDTLKENLQHELNVAVAGDNENNGLSYQGSEVAAMSKSDVKKLYGEDSKTYFMKERLDEEDNKIKKNTIELLADIIEKNATIAQQIEDENRAYERQLDLIEKNVADPEMKKRAKEGLKKSHNENSAKLQFEQFKQESDWVTIFDDLNRVSTSTIDTMADKIEDFSTKAGLSVEVVKQLREALNKLRDEQTERNPLPQMFGGVHEGNAIGKFIEANFKEGDAPTKTVHIDDAKAKELGIGKAGGDFTKSQLENKQASAYSKSTKAITAFANKVNAVVGVLQPVVDLLKAVGSEDSLFGKIIGGASNAVNSAASMAGNLDTLSNVKGLEFLSGAGPYGAAIAGGLSIASSIAGSFGADYSAYNKAKVRYENLTSIWDELISKKREYMNVHWGTEASNAAKEAKEMLDSEIEITKSTAKSRLSSGSSAGSHSIGYRIWNKYGDDSKKSPNNPFSSLKWKDVAPEISQKYGVKFESASDFLNMSPEVLSEIKKNYSGLWANLDGDFREYLDKLISYGEQAKEMAEDETEKRTGLRFTDMVESFGEALTEMSVSADKFSEDIAGNLKKAILKGMVENLYKKRIQGLIDLADKYSNNEEKGLDGSEYSKREWDEITNESEKLSKDMKARQELYASYYGWSDSSDSSTNTVKGITEEQADILLSYINAMRLDLSVVRAEQAKQFPEMSEIAKSQLTQLNFIAQNTLRNADSAAHIENLLNSVINGQNKIRVS